MHTTKIDTKTTSLISAKKAQGITAKVISMIGEDRYCPDIIQQVEAAIGLLKSTKKELLKGHLDHCLVTRLKQDKKQTIDELLRIYSLGQNK
jgi:DNA-binding FrmR family transcriptional regulator